MQLIEFNVKRSTVKVFVFIYPDVAQQCMGKVAGARQIFRSSSLKQPEKKKKYLKPPGSETTALCVAM